jgi:hypothetical protein
MSDPDGWHPRPFRIMEGPEPHFIEDECLGRQVLTCELPYFRTRADKSPDLLAEPSARNIANFIGEDKSAGPIKLPSREGLP